MVIHSELEAKETELITCKEKLAQNDMESKELKVKVENLQKQLLEAKTMSSANNELMKEKLKQLEMALKNTSDERHRLELKFVDVEKECFDAKNGIVALKETLEKVKAEQALTEDKNSTYRSQITQLQQELKDSSKDSSDSGAANATLLEFRAQLSEILSENRETILENDKILATLSDLRRDKQLIEQRFKDLHEEKQKLVAQTPAVDTSALKNEVIKGKQELKEKEKAIVDLNCKTKRLEDEVAQLRIKYEELEALKIKYDEIQASLQLRQNETMEKQDEAETLRNKLVLIKTEKRDLEKTLEREIREKTELKTQVTNILAEIARLEEQLHEVKASHATIQTEKEGLVNQIETMHEQHHEVKREIEDIVRREWAEKLAELEKTNANVNQRCQAMEDTRMQLETDRERLQAEVLEMRKE